MINPKTIFMTGFPGFIAGRLVERLALPETHFLLLVQEHFMEKAKRDIAKIAEITKVPTANFAIICGDISQASLGMSESDLARVLKETNSVFHLAAVYDLGVEKELAYRINVDGTKNVNDIVTKIENLTRYNYISTCYVAGKRDDHIYEAELEHDKGFRNYYEETKYFAELEVSKMFTDYPVTIYRPSVVCGDSKTGETAKYDGIYYVITFLMRFPEVFRLVNVGNKHVRLNLVPIDFVIDSIAALSNDAEAVGKVVALADPNPVTTKDVCDSIAKAATNKKSVITPPAKLVEAFLNSPISPPITGLPHSGVPYFFIPQTYDTSVANKLLAKHGITCPPFSEYVSKLVQFVEKNPSL